MHTDDVWGKQKPSCQASTTKQWDGQERVSEARGRRIACARCNSGSKCPAAACSQRNASWAAGEFEQTVCKPGQSEHGP
eukprot:1139845-Pelagomonas_calceolata.AAC.2